jgi:ABC-type transport system substrate-binding protein
MPKKTNRRQFLTLLGAGSVTALSGQRAGGDATQQEDGESDQTVDPASEHGQLRLISSSVPGLDPIQERGSTAVEKIRQVYETLTHYPNGVPRLETQLLDGVELSDDLLTYTFTLRQGVSYHDNPVKDELTAQDVKYSWRRTAESDQSNNATYVLNSLGVEHDTDEAGNVVPDSLAIEVIDDYTLSVTLSEPNTAALDVITYSPFSVMPAGLVGDISGYNGEYTPEQINTEVMVGTGPFEFESWETDSEFRMSAFGDYWGEGPYLDSLRWEILNDPSEIWQYGRNQNADIISVIDTEYDPSLVDAETTETGREVGTYGPIENGETLDYTSVSRLRTFYVAFNAPKVPKAVRQAVAYVTNQKEFIDRAFDRRATAAASFTPPRMWPGGFDAYQTFRDEHPYSLDEVDTDSAQAVLEDAGYTADDPFELTFTTYPSDAFQEYGSMLQDAVSELGVSVTVEEMSFSELLASGRSGDLMFHSLGLFWAWVDPALGFERLAPENTDTDDIPEEGNGFYLNWNAVDSANADKAQTAWDQVQNNLGPDEEAARNEAYVEMEEARRDDAVLLPLYHPIVESFRYQWVNGPRVGALGRVHQQYNSHWIDENRTPTEPPEVVDGQQPRDLDYDGKYEDVNGDGRVSIADVFALFENRDDEAVQDDLRHFDFDGDDQLDLADIQALLDER